jgi:hypothetical protein
VKAPALYRHIGSKSAMTELILRRVMDRFDYHRDDDAAWDQEIGRLMRAMREHLLAHPWVVDLTRDGQVLGLQRLSGDIFDLLAATGLSTPEVYRHYRLLIWTVWGFVATELANRNRAPDTSPDGRQAGRRRVAPRPPGGEGAPRVPAPYDVVDLDELFDTAVEHFVFGVRGIAARDAD